MSIAKLTEAVLAVRRVTMMMKRAAELKDQGDTWKSRKMAKKALAEARKLVRKAKTRKFRTHKRLIIEGIDSLRLIAEELEMEAEVNSILEDDPEIIDVTPVETKRKLRRKNSLVKSGRGPKSKAKYGYAKG